MVTLIVIGVIRSVSMEKKKAKNKKPKIKNLTPEEQLKWEIAKEIGVYDKVLESGWRSLSAKESGRIGGIVASRKKQLNKTVVTPADETVQTNSSNIIL
jgi:hypothetical protein